MRSNAKGGPNGRKFTGYWELWTEEFLERSLEERESSERESLFKDLLL